MAVMDTRKSKQSSVRKGEGRVCTSSNKQSGTQFAGGPPANHGAQRVCFGGAVMAVAVAYLLLDSQRATNMAMAQEDTCAASAEGMSQPCAGPRLLRADAHATHPVPCHTARPAACAVPIGTPSRTMHHAPHTHVARRSCTPLG